MVNVLRAASWHKWHCGAVIGAWGMRCLAVVIIQARAVLLRARPRGFDEIGDQSHQCVEYRVLEIEIIYEAVSALELSMHGTECKEG